jgi:hypothetical protein
MLKGLFNRAQKGIHTKRLNSRNMFGKNTKRTRRRRSDRKKAVVAARQLLRDGQLSSQPVGHRQGLANSASLQATVLCCR